MLALHTTKGKNKPSTSGLADFCLLVIAGRPALTGTRDRLTADYDQKGYGVGDPPFSGDYFLPGSSLSLVLTAHLVLLIF
jgi:hypothetical protein